MFHFILGILSSLVVAAMICFFQFGTRLVSRHLTRWLDDFAQRRVSNIQQRGEERRRTDGPIIRRGATIPGASAAAGPDVEESAKGEKSKGTTDSRYFFIIILIKKTYFF